MKKSLLIAGVAALALAGCKGKGTENSTASTAANVAAPQGQNWTETVAATPVGGFVKGNPNAAVKLIEFGSYSCGACKAFSDDSHDKLESYIQKGTLSFEFRSVVRGPQDIAPTLLAACNGPGPFFMITKKLFDDQGVWASPANFNAITPELQEEWASKGPTVVAAQFSKALGLNDMVAKLGVSTQKADACLADKAAIDRLQALQVSLTKDGVESTPTFMINGQKIEPGTPWSTLEPLLVKAGA